MITLHQSLKLSIRNGAGYALKNRAASIEDAANEILATLPDGSFIGQAKPNRIVFLCQDTEGHWVHVMLHRVYAAARIY